MDSIENGLHGKHVIIKDQYIVLCDGKTLSICFRTLIFKIWHEMLLFCNTTSDRHFTVFPVNIENKLRTYSNKTTI